MTEEEIKEIEGYFKEFDKCTIGYGVAVRIVNKVPALLAALKEKDELLESQSTLLKWRDSRIQILESALQQIKTNALGEIYGAKNVASSTELATKALSANEGSK